MGSIYFNSTSFNSLTGSFSVALSALDAARVSLQTVGHNIANVNTPGYSRQIVNLATRMPHVTSVGAIGQGVDVQNIEAIRDRFLDSQLAMENQELGRLSMLDTLLGRMESIYNPTASTGLSEATDSFFGAFNDLAANPESLAQREEVLSTAQALANNVNHTISQLNGMKESIDEQLNTVISEVNAILQEIANANVQLAGNDALNRNVEDVYDRRQQLYKELNELMNVQSFMDESDNMTITTPNGVPLVVANHAATLSTTPNGLDQSTLDVMVDFNGVDRNITHAVQSGTMGALLTMRDTVIENAVSKQRMFAAVLADTINIEHRLGTDIDGNAGDDFFVEPFTWYDSSAGATILTVDMVGENATYEVNYSVNANSAASVTGIDLNAADLDNLSKHDFTIEFSAGGNYTVTDQTINEVVSTGTMAGPGTISFAGMDVTLDALPADGDSFDLTFDGRTGLTGHEYRIEFTSATDYEVYDISAKDSTPVSTGTLAGDGFIFFDGLAVQISGARVAGDFFQIGYAGLELDPDLTATTLAAAGPLGSSGLPEPGNNENALRMANLNYQMVVGLGNTTFSNFQGNEIANVGNQKATASLYLESQQMFYDSLEGDRASISGVSLDEEAAELVQLQQLYSAAARYLSQVNDIMATLIAALGQ